MLGLGALGQFPLGGGPYGTVTITVIDWYAELSTPVRFQRTPRAAVAVNHQTLAFSPNPIVSFSWFEELSKPQKLTKPGLAASQQQFFAYQDDPTTVTPFAWFANLSLPVRLKRGLRPELQRVFTTDTAVIPLTKTNTWFAPMSEPVRLKPGIAARLQEFFTAPPRLLPTPTIFGVLSALETKDVFLGGVAAWNRATSAEIGIIDTSYFATEIGLIEQGDASDTIASVSVSILIV